MLPVFVAHKKASRCLGQGLAKVGILPFSELQIW
jgi:hypothetical protein